MNNCKTKNIPAKQLIGVIPTLEDYFDMTYVDFKDISEYVGNTNAEKQKHIFDQWTEMKLSGKYEFHESISSFSKYLIDKESGDIYRLSDHWDDVSSCRWTIGGYRSSKAYYTRYGWSYFCVIGKANIKDFSRNENDLVYWMLEAHNAKISE